MSSCNTLQLFSFHRTVTRQTQHKCDADVHKQVSDCGVKRVLGTQRNVRDLITVGQRIDPRKHPALVVDDRQRHRREAFRGDHGLAGPARGHADGSSDRPISKKEKFFEKIGKIVTIYEAIGSDGGSRHDFG